MSIIYIIVHFFAQALALKLAATTLHAPEEKNTYAQALSISALFVFMNFVFGFIPFFGVVFYLIAWCAVVMKTYGFSLSKSIVVAVLQTLFGWVLLLLLKLVGFAPQAAQSVF